MAKASNATTKKTPRKAAAAKRSPKKTTKAAPKSKTKRTKDTFVEEPIKENDEQESAEMEEEPIEVEEDGSDEENETDTDTTRLDLIPKQETSLVPFDPLQKYLMEIRRYSLLSREEEHDLAVAYVEDEDVKAAEKLVTGNLRLVVKIAMDYRKYWMNLLDLIQEGNVGLMQAVKNYDPYRGVKLSSYSSFWIKAYILKFIIDNWSLVKIGTTQAQRKLFFNLKKEKENLMLLGYKPDAETLAKRLDVKPEQVREMDQRISGGDLSLDRPVSNDGQGQDHHVDFLESDNTDVDEELADAELRQLFHDKLKEFRQRLTDKEAYLFDHRLLTEQPQTLQEIGDEYGVSRERIRQIEERLIKKLRKFFEEEVPEMADIDIIPAG